MNVIFFGFRRDGLAFLDDAQAAGLDGATVRGDDVLLNITGASIGRVTLAPADLDGARVNQHVCIIRPNEHLLDPRFLSTYLSSPVIQAQITSDNYGVTRQALTKGQVLDFEVPLPTLAEQRRIADKLDVLLARVDACRERLDRTPILIARLRHAVYSAAVTGALTADWREERGRSLQEWSRSALGDLIGGIEAGLNVQCDERPPEGSERGLVKISAVTWGTYDEAQSKTLRSNHAVPETSRIRPGDFLISRANTLDLVGACVIVGEVTRNLFLSDKVLRLVMPTELRPWTLFALRSAMGRRQIEARASGNQLSMRNLSQANLRAVEVPLPPTDELAEIVRIGLALLAKADRLEALTENVARHIGSMSSALLAKAFLGELVPQDTNDESAAATLARVHAARVAR